MGQKETAPFSSKPKEAAPVFSPMGCVGQQSCRDPSSLKLCKALIFLTSLHGTPLLVKIGIWLYGIHLFAKQAGAGQRHSKPK